MHQQRDLKSKIFDSFEENRKLVFVFSPSFHPFGHLPITIVLKLRFSSLIPLNSKCSPKTEIRERYMKITRVIFAGGAAKRPKMPRGAGVSCVTAENRRHQFGQVWLRNQLTRIKCCAVLKPTNTSAISKEKK